MEPPILLVPAEIHQPGKEPKAPTRTDPRGPLYSFKKLLDEKTRNELEKIIQAEKEKLGLRKLEGKVSNEYFKTRTSWEGMQHQPKGKLLVLSEELSGGIRFVTPRGPTELFLNLEKEEKGPPRISFDGVLGTPEEMGVALRDLPEPLRGALFKAAGALIPNEKTVRGIEQRWTEIAAVKEEARKKGAAVRPVVSKARPKQDYEENLKLISFVDTGDYGVVKATDPEPVLETLGIVQCIACTLWDPESKAGGIAHFWYLKDPGIGMEKYLAAFERAGGKLHPKTQVRLIGGKTGDSEWLVVRLRDLLRDKGTIVEEDLLGTGRRDIRMDVRDGSMADLRLKAGMEDDPKPLPAVEANALQKLARFRNQLAGELEPLYPGLEGIPRELRAVLGYLEAAEASLGKGEEQTAKAALVSATELMERAAAFPGMEPRADRQSQLEDLLLRFSQDARRLLPEPPPKQAAGTEELQPRLLAALERLQRRAEKLVKLLPAKKEIETSSSPIHIDPVIEKLTVLMRTLLAHPSPPAAAEQVKGILRAVDRQILAPGLRGLRKPLVSSGYFPWPVFYYVHSLPHAEDWLVFPAGTFHSNEHLYQAQQRAIAAYSQRASALAFGRNGPHLRTSPFGPDSIDVETAPDLLVGFIHFLKNRLEQVNRSRQQGKRNDRLEKETREYVGALWNGLMVPTIGKYDKKDYEEAYFSLLREAAGKVGVNLSQILGLSIRLFPKFLPKEKMPDFLRFRNEVFLQEEIEVGYVGYLTAVHDEPQTGVAPTALVSVWDLTVGTESADPYIERLRKNWDNPEQMEALEKIYRFLHQQANAGVEEQRRETRPAVPETRWTVIGPSVVKHFSGLEEFAGIERRVLIDPGNPEGRAQMLVWMGGAGAEAAHYYGGLEEANSLAAMAGRFMEIVPHSPREPGFLNQIEQALVQAGLPMELIAAGIEALAAGTEELRQAA